MKSAKGNFEIEMIPKEDAEAPVGRFIINKSYHGGLEGTAVGQMISKRLENGTAIYFAIEEFSGSVDGKSGSFTLLHKGSMNSESQSLEISVLEGSGSNELKTLSGSMNIEQESGNHAYELKYEMHNT